MRDIKFRAWEQNGKNMILSDEVGDHTLNSLIDEMPYVLMQYTGLKDQEGIEIWEGDVVTVTNVDPAPIYKVMFRRGCWVVEGKHWTHNSDLYPFEKVIKVIGNIYENPDLIKNND